MMRVVPVRENSILQGGEILSMGSTATTVSSTGRLPASSLYRFSGTSCTSADPTVGGVAMR